MAADETDEQLMRRFQRGEARAFELLMHRHRTPVFAFLLRLTGERSRAEDLAQETFLRLVKGAAGWEPRAAVRTWLFTIARNLAADGARRQALRATVSLDDPPPGDPRPRLDPPAAGPAPDELADAAGLRPRLEAALAALPEPQREVFLLREHAGLSFAEIAEATGANENTVKSRLRYALLALRERLAADGIVAEPGPGEDLTMTHPPRRDELLDLALGLLGPGEAAALEAHAAGCDACRAELAALRQTRRLLAELPPIEAPEGGAAELLAAARQAAEAATTRPQAAATRPQAAPVRPGRESGFRWWWGGSLGLAGAAALALLVFRFTEPPAGGPGSAATEALMGRADPSAAPAEAPAAGRTEAERRFQSEPAAAPAAELPPAATAMAAPAAEAPAPPVAQPPAPPARRSRPAPPPTRDALARGPAEREVSAAGALADEAAMAAPLAPVSPAQPSVAAFAAPAAPPAGASEAKAELAEASRPAMAKRAAAPRAGSAAGATAAPQAAAGGIRPCWREAQRRLTRDAAGRLVGRVREGRYPAGGGEVALWLEERFGPDGRPLGATVRAGGEQFTVGGEEIEAGRLEPLPGVALAASAAEAARPAPRCAP